jgi:hypothetical protein
MNTTQQLADWSTVQYYGAMCGQWSGEYRFVITDWKMMTRAIPLGIDRFRVIVMHYLKWHKMATSVHFQDPRTVRHTTRISKWGMPELFSVEWFTLNENGQSFGVTMAQRLSPIYWPVRHFVNGTGIVEAPSVGARYALPWIGGKIDQQVLVVSEGVQLTQSTAWFQGTALLKRRG